MEKSNQLTGTSWIWSDAKAAEAAPIETNWFRRVVTIPANRAVVSGGGRYVWISGTSMASPHVAGVAALIRQVHPKMPSGAVAALLRSSATSLACPSNWPANDPRHCTGGTGNTSFYGAGMVNALGAVSH